jgi:16S rRNA (cytidine1402-2'-O)-methyltransferase
MYGTLYIVATPIGNMEDVTERAKKTLGAVSLILAEDTRVAKKLLTRLGIETPTERLDANATSQAIAKAIERLAEGKSLALISDAGTPAISDPGSWLVSEALRSLGNDLQVVPIPGPSSVTAALSVSGFNADTFTFFGFPPHKKGRAARFAEMADCRHLAVFLESPHRIAKALNELAVICPERRIVVCRELTKMFETAYRGTAAELAAEGVIREQGEFIVVMEGKR